MSDDLSDKLDTITIHQGALTDWEEKFIEDITRKHDNGHSFSERQLQIIDKIYQKAIRRRR